MRAKEEPMKTISYSAFTLLLVSGIQTLSSRDVVAGAELGPPQIAFTALYGCSGGCDESSPPVSEDVLTDTDGSNGIPTPVGAWSPDGTRQLVGNGDIYLIPATGGPGENLTNHPAYDVMPAWSPDGTRVAFASDRDGPLDLYVMNADGSGVRRLTTGTGMAWRPTWAADGERLAFACIVDPVSVPWWSATGNRDICVIHDDGSGFARLTSDPGTDDSPDWSPTGDSIVFTTTRYGGFELVLMRSDGTDLIPVSPGLQGDSPRWSPDGSRLAFTYLVPWDPDAPWMPQSFVALIDADGSDFTSVAWGYGPVWRPRMEGANAVPVASFTYECSGFTCSFDASHSTDSDGTIASYGWRFGDGRTAAGAAVTHTFAGGHHDVRLIVMDDRAALGTSVQNVNQPPIVSFTTACSGLACTFNGSACFDPDGAIAFFSWHFGDRTDSTGPATKTHTYAAPGTYVVTLQATDQDYGIGTYRQTVTVISTNAAPIASFTSSCAALTCSFNGSGSSDSDGSIVSHAWTFGDGSSATGAAPSRTYAAGGTYTVTLTVRDDKGASSTHAQSVTLTPPTMHVGDLDGASVTHQNSWAATVTIGVHDGTHAPVANASVNGAWSDGGSGSCTTAANGRCAVSRSGNRKTTTSVIFRIANVARAPFVYTPASNHDIDGDSSGATISVARR
jgi:PKD repeat protein